MAGVSTFNHVPEGRIGAIGHANVSRIASIGHVAFSSTVADSVSLDYSLLEFDNIGEPIVTDIVTVTSSGNWTTTLVDTGDGTTWVTRFPTNGSNGETSTIIVDAPYSGSGRGVTVRFTVGTATADLQIWQYGT